VYTNDTPHKLNIVARLLRSTKEGPMSQSFFVSNSGFVSVTEGLPMKPVITFFILALLETEHAVNVEDLQTLLLARMR
jgi:hypothetical protein